MRYFIIYICCVLALSCKYNRQDAKGLKQGRWRIYYDDNNKCLLYKGRYKDHKQVGKFVYFMPDGRRYLKEDYLPDHWVKTTYYHHTGKIKSTGMAKLITGTDTTFYRWEGNWYKYDSTGKLTEIAFYKFGKFAWFVKKY